MRRFRKRNVLAAGENLMASMLFIPFRHRRVLVHVFDDISPADARVVSTKADFAFLCSVRNDAHLSSTEVIIEQILEPHTGDKQEVPAVGATLRNVVLTAIATYLAVLLAGQDES